MPLTKVKHSLPVFNPFARLGRARYSTVAPLATTILAAVLIEFIVNSILHSPEAVGIPAIFVFIALIVYFSFRDGIKGGLITTGITVGYYLYIIYSRDYSGEQLRGSLETTVLLGSLYAGISVVIGWLKQTLDRVIVQEIEARELAEQGRIRLESILDQLPVGVILADAKTNSMQANRYLEKILQQKLIPEIPDDISKTRNTTTRNGKVLKPNEWPITQALREGKRVFAQEIEVIKPEGKRLFLRVNATPIRNGTRKIVAAVSTVYDITTEKEHEQRKNDFINMASHELKTPITSMKLYLELLERRVQKSQDIKTIEALKKIQRQTDRLQELINDLLDVSRIQTGKLRFQKESFDLCEGVEETIEVVGQLAKNHRILFKKKASINVYADRFRIYQVLTNLLTNAIKYSPPESKIIIKVTKEDKKAVVSVQDFGIGIDQDQLKKVFDRLYQVTDSKEKTFPGLGMGLYISKEIIRRHHGKIWVESQKGKGSTFNFTLPLSSS